MNNKTLLPVYWMPILCFLLAGASCNDENISTKVDNEERISETSGGFDGDLTTEDLFGSAIAAIGDLEGDGVTDLAVGTPFDDDEGTDRGAIWILFMDDDGRVDIERKISEDEGLFLGNLENGDAFGSAVASIGDLDNDGFLDLAVGAPKDDTTGTNRGAVWILFLNANGTVRQAQKISGLRGGFIGDLNDGDQFGGAVASIGDLDGDGINDIAVGARHDGDGGTDTGAVWILLMNSDGTVKSQQKISSEAGSFDGNLNDGDLFGSAVAGIGDLDGDGVNDLAVGASQDSDGGMQRGAVWILFLNADGTVRADQKISQNEGEFDGNLDDGSHFGSAIADTGDLNEDGITDLAVGAPQSDDGGVDRGTVWILFMENNGEVKSEIRISSTDNFDGDLADGDQFGSAVAGIGDLNNDGVLDIAAGAPFSDNGGTNKGAVWILFLDRTETDFDIFGNNN